MESKIAALVRVGWKQAGDDGQEWWTPVYMFDRLPADTMTMSTDEAHKAAEEAALAWVAAGSAATHELSRFRL